MRLVGKAWEGCTKRMRRGVLEGVWFEAWMRHLFVSCIFNQACHSLRKTTRCQALSLLSESGLCLCLLLWLYVRAPVFLFVAVAVVVGCALSRVWTILCVYLREKEKGKGKEGERERGREGERDRECMYVCR